MPLETFPKRGSGEAGPSLSQWEDGGSALALFRRDKFSTSLYLIQDSAPPWVKWTPPACAPPSFSARRTAMRRGGGTMNIMNPPPPAPETFPPIAAQQRQLHLDRIKLEPVEIL